MTILLAQEMPSLCVFLLVMSVCARLMGKRAVVGSGVARGMTVISLLGTVDVFVDRGQELTWLQ